MRQRFTAFAAMFIVAALLSPMANAQVADVTVREINAIPQSQIDALNALGTSMTSQDITDNAFNELQRTDVRFTAVVLSDPTLSGLSTPTDGLPSRVHFFVRDTSAATLGAEGMGIQIVDGSWQENGVLSLLVGDVIEIVGQPAQFGNGQQVAPQSITPKGTYSDLGLPASILEPVVVTTGDLVKVVGGDGQLQANWDNLASLRNQYVRIEDAVVQRRDLSDDRPGWTFSSDGGTTEMTLRDVSLSYRNDRFSTYNDPPFRLPDDDFVPPPPGSGINLQGFSVIYDFDEFNLFTPDEAILMIAPFERSDLEVTVTPPLVNNVSSPETVLGTVDSPTITAEVDADPSRTLTSVVLRYITSSNATEMEVAGTNTSGNIWEFTIPPAADEDFVTYYIVATDNLGAESQRIDITYRVLANGISKIYHVQETADGGPGDSPFVDLTTAMNITGSINSRPDSSGWYIVQDDVTGAPWSGIVVEATDAVVALGLGTGDLVNITGGTIVEIRGGFRFDRSGDVTAISEPTVALVTPGAAPQVYKTVTTDVLQDPDIAEGHESMMLRFENVTLTTNQADGSNDFGEWAVSSDGTADNQVRVDDSSPLVSSSYNDDLVPGSVYSFHQGVWSNTFGNFKLLPEDLSDIGEVTNVGTEDLEVPGDYALGQNYPNPFNPSTLIQYDVPAASRVSIQVFDMLGRKVATLVNGQVSAGTHTVSFDARSLASGVYLYRLEAAGNVINRSMMLLK